MSPLAELIARDIMMYGPMDIGRYMALALGHPKYGYYMTRDPFGAAGDFTTAPEISQMFGELIGAWAADLWLRMGRPARFTLAEAGPGRGTLMADALRATQAVPGFHQAMRIELVETSPLLRQAQAEALQGHDPVWHEDVSALDGGDGPLILIANELLDALPIRQFQWQDGGWAERCVQWDGKRFALALRPGVETRPPAGLPRPADGDIFELSDARMRFVTRVNDALIARNGAALFIDYGHAKTSFGDTLQAMRDHQFSSPFDAPGEADITSHVDFEQAVRNCRCRIHGPVEQGAFLKRLGIDARAAALAAKDDQVMRALDRLTDANQMGSLFKVLALSHGCDAPAGFE